MPDKPHPSASAQRRNRRPIQLAALRGFELAARRLSFTQAADELALTQSSISRQIASLERQVGEPLFVRKTRALELTPAGARLLAAATQALAGIDRCVDEIRGAADAPRVSLTTYASFASLWLVPRLAAFQSEHPQIEIRIDASDRQVDLRADGIDLAIRRCRPQQIAGIAGVTPLWEEMLTPALSPHLLERSGIALQAPADLAKLPLIVLDDEWGPAQAGAWPRWFAFAGAPEPTPSAGRLVFGFIDQAVQAAVRGQGAVLGLSPLIEEVVANGHLTTPFAELKMATGYRYYLIVNEDHAMRPEVGQFVAWLLAAAAGGPLRST
ncbi:LysR substrate-binding domain-containing protein [Piscinibacter sakaiensis]|uniref:LysR substrate-binding domain-containing protein n=1 Tax=Piscinibacter sakaiensis TaxID=1547922 RepID=UPI003AAEB591